MVVVLVVIVARDRGQHPQLATGQLAVGHGHTQHRRETLHIPAVLEPQGAELVVAQGAGLVAFKLVAVLRGTLADELAIEFGVLVHVCVSGCRRGPCIGQGHSPGRASGKAVHGL
jgi:hypothetical protein